jgi:uncharacterized protein
MIQRKLKENIVSVFGSWKTIVLYGARQVGKTTLLKEIVRERWVSYKYYDADILSERGLFESENLDRITTDIWRVGCVIIDEAQKIANIGRILKVLHDHMPHIQWIASGSSSFDLAQKTRESMAGRTYEFFLSPLLFAELDLSLLQAENSLDTLLRYGLYPSPYEHSGDIARRELTTLTNQILSRDILEIEGIRKWPIIVRLLELLALQIGQIVSYSELARQLGISTTTVQKYIHLLEESFIIFSLFGFSRNLRNELKKSPKIYFYDIGIRNAIIEDWKPIHLRSDIGNLWENFIIAEIYKHTRSLSYGKGYFWRTKEWKEIDYILEKDGEIRAFEIKWWDKVSKYFDTFHKWYPNSQEILINRESFYSILRSL